MDRRKIGFAGLFYVFLFLLLAVLVESGMRLRHWMKYGTTGTALVNYSVDIRSGLRIPSSTGRVRINSLGFRGPEVEILKPMSRLRLAFLGASTTFSAEASSNETTWPHLVWKKLKAAYTNADMDYLNAAVPGYSTSDSLVNLEHRVKPLKPDVIVIYEATNDLSYDTRQLARKQGLYRDNADEKGWLARISLTWYLVEKNWQVLARQRAAASGQRRLTFEPTELSRAFRKRLIELILASKKVAPVVAVATFSHKFRREQSEEEQLKAANSSLYYMPYMSVRGLLDAFDEYNFVIRDVAKQTGVILIGEEFMIPGDDRHFNDSVHFKDAGNEVMARRVANALIQSRGLDKLLKGSRNQGEPE